MKSLFLLLGLLAPTLLFAQNEAAQTAKIDSVERSLTYQRGTVKLDNGVANLRIPGGFKFLSATQTAHVLTDFWGNPPSQSEGVLGMILPEPQGVLGEGGYAFIVEYEPMGYVKDDDADDIDYDELLATMQKESTEGNAERTKGGYESVNLVGWAAKPFYDEDRKILHWAKELKFGQNSENTLNYNIRVLGRKGVLILNAVSTMKQLPLVNQNLDKVLDIVQFTDGNKYSDFNPDLDEVAAWSIGGLVAGKVLAKVGFFAVILKFWKVIALAVAGGGSALWRFIRGRREDEVTPATTGDDTQAEA